MKLRHAAALALLLILFGCENQSYDQYQQIEQRILANTRTLSPTQKYTVLGPVGSVPDPPTSKNCVRSLTYLAYDKYGPDVDALIDYKESLEIQAGGFYKTCSANAVHFRAN